MKFSSGEGLQAASRQAWSKPNNQVGVLRRLLYLAVLSMVAMLVFVPAAWAQGQEVTVSMEDNFFEPANITVEPGTTVTWVQNGANGHTTTSDDGLWDSGLIDGGSGESYSFTFDEPGTFNYHCIPHQDIGMVGTVTVSGGSDDSTATSSASASTSPSASASASASASPSASASALADTGGPSLAFLAAGALLGLGLLGLIAWRRAS